MELRNFRVIENMRMKTEVDKQNSAIYSRVPWNRTSVDSLRSEHEKENDWTSFLHCQKSFTEYGRKWIFFTFLSTGRKKSRFFKKDSLKSTSYFLTRNRY